MGACFTRAQLCRLYGLNPRTFQQRCKAAGITLIPRQLILPAQVEQIRAALGPWEKRYNT
jgi:hypothetical protein